MGHVPGVDCPESAHLETRRCDSDHKLEGRLVDSPAISLSLSLRLSGLPVNRLGGTARRGVSRLFAPSPLESRLHLNQGTASDLLHRRGPRRRRNAGADSCGARTAHVWPPARDSDASSPARDSDPAQRGLQQPLLPLHHGRRHPSRRPRPRGRTTLAGVARRRCLRRSCGRGRRGGGSGQGDEERRGEGG
jgi:hypothetical protein